MSRLKQPPVARIALFLSLLAIILGAKLNLIERYGSDLPYWDQWDAEGDSLFRPYVEGRLSATDVFATHNEHRPVFTRLLALGLFELGDRHWDARVQLVANAALHAVLALLLCALASRALPPLALAAFAGATALFFSMPVSWENTLSGFQSQFYFVLLFSALHLGGTLLAPPRSLAWWLAPLAGAAAILSMASGMLSALAILAATGLRALRNRAVTRGDLWVGGINGALAVAGWLLQGHVPDHDSLEAASLGAWIDAFLHQYSWPVTFLWAAPLGLAAPLAILIAFWRRRIDGAVAFTILGACAWFALHAAAISYARGADVHGYSSRYSDTLAAGVLVHLLAASFLATTAATARARRGWIAFTVVFAACTLGGLSREWAASHHDVLRGMREFNEARIAAVRNYVATRDPTFFKKEPWTELPYPSAERLAGLLDNPTIRGALPASVRPPAEFDADPRSTRFSRHKVGEDGAEPPLGLAAWISAPGEDARFVSTEFVVGTGRVSLFAATEGDGMAQLHLIDERGRSHAPLGSVAAQPSWKRINFVVPEGRYRLEAAHSGPGWLAFTQPVDDARLSALSRKFVRAGPWLLGIGTLLGLLAIIRLRPAATAVGRRAADTPEVESPERSGVASARDYASAGVAVLLGAALVAVLAARLGFLQPIATARPPVPPHATEVSPFSIPATDASGPADARFVGGVFLLAGGEQRWFGTYVGGDAFTGRVESSPFAVAGRFLYVPIAGYPNSPGNELALEILDERGQPERSLRFEGTNAREWPGIWRVPVAAWRGKTARLVLTDGQTTPGGWLAVGTPRLSNRSGPAWLDGVPRNYGWYAVSAVAIGGLLLLPGLALRTWQVATGEAATLARTSRQLGRLARAARAPLHYGTPAWLPLPGLLLLAAFGLLVWIAGPDAMDLPADLWLGAHVAIAAGLARRAWCVGGALTRGEAGALGVYACVVIAALAFGVLPLAVGHEFDRASTAQSRMIASPPDHAIPYRTAIYFLHGKDGREDRATYFGNEWSVASRGPIAPLAIAAVFSLFDARLTDPPGNTLESWPAAQDAFYLARIVGILTNALVVLGGAALAAGLTLGWALRPGGVAIAEPTGRKASPTAASRVALVWLASAPVVAINTDFLWPKLLATYFVALAALAVVKEWPIGRVAVLAALAYLSHPVGGLFVPPLVLFLAARVWSMASGERRVRMRVMSRRCGEFALVFLACVAPWFAFKAWVAHPDVFLRYPIGDGRGFAAAESAASWLRCRFDNLWVTLVPGAFFFSDFMHGWIEGAVSQPLRWAMSYAKSLPGALGFVSFALGIVALGKRGIAPVLREVRTHLLVGAFALMLVFWGFSHDGLGRNCLEPLPVVLTAYAAAVMPPTWRGWRWVLLATALEAASVRTIGVVFAPSFNRVDFNAEAVALAIVATGATILPALWFWWRQGTAGTLARAT